MINVGNQIWRERAFWSKLINKFWFGENAIRPPLCHYPRMKWKRKEEEKAIIKNSS